MRLVSSLDRRLKDLEAVEEAAAADEEEDEEAEEEEEDGVGDGDGEGEEAAGEGEVPLPDAGIGRNGEDDRDCCMPVEGEGCTDV